MEVLRERCSLEELHTEECRVRTSGMMPENVVHATDVGMSNLAGEMNFTPKSLRRAGVTGQVQPNAFDRDAFAKLEILCLEDLAHSAFPEVRCNPEPRGEEGSEGERGRQAVGTQHPLDFAPEMWIGTVSLEKTLSFGSRAGDGPRIEPLDFRSPAGCH